MNLVRPIRRGFTLLEMLVSLAILGVLMVTLNTFLFSMSELWGGGRDQRLFDQHARAATALVRNAFELATYGPSASGVALKDVDDGAGTTKPPTSIPAVKSSSDTSGATVTLILLLSRTTGS